MSELQEEFERRLEASQCVYNHIAQGILPDDIVALEMLPLNIIVDGRAVLFNEGLSVAAWMRFMRRHPDQDCSFSEDDIVVYALGVSSEDSSVI